MNMFQIINIYTHVIVGGLLLVVGLIPLISQKGGTWHKRAGRIYAKLYLVVLISALIGIIFFRSPPALIAITLSAWYGFFSSVRALKIKTTGPRLIDNAMSVCAIGAGALLLTIMSKNSSASWSPVMGYSLVGITTTIALYDLSRNFWVRTWTRKIWPVDHGFKIVGNYFAAASAASGNLIRDFQPWSQILPSIIGTVLSVVLVYLFLRSNRVKTTSSPNSDS